MTKIVYNFLIIFLLIQVGKQECQSLNEELIEGDIDNFKIKGELGEYKSIKYDKCESWFLDDLGYPCQMIWTKGEQEVEGDYDMKDLYILVPSNLDHYRVKNQEEAIKKLMNLKLYPREEDIGNEDGDEDEDMAIYLDEFGEENQLPVIKHDVLANQCFKIDEDQTSLINKDSLPFVKNIHAPYDKSELPRSQSMRFFHHTYAMVSVKTLWDRNQYTFDSIMKPLDGKAKNDFVLLSNFRTSMVVLNYLFSIIKNLAGISPFPEDSCKDIKSINKAYLASRKKQLLFWIDELKDQMYEHTNQNNTKTDGFINQRIEEQFGIGAFAQKADSQEDEQEMKEKKLKRKLASNKITCDQYFKKNPVFIPDISVHDFVFTIKPQLKASDPEADEKNKSSFKDLSIEELLDFVTLSSYTYPEFINESEKFETIYNEDEMLKILKLHDTDISPSKHRYFYVIAQFYKLFQEFFDRYVINKVVFYNCFTIEDYSKPDLYCPQFLKDMLNVLEKQERVSMHKLVSLDLHYIYENPKTLVLTIDKFLLKALEYSEAFTDQKLRIKDQKGNIIENSQIDYESLNNDFASQAYHQKIVERIVPEIQEISKISLRKTQYYEKLVGSLKQFQFEDCSQDIDPEFMDQPLNQDFASIMIKFQQTFNDVIPDDTRPAIQKICDVVRDRNPNDMESAYDNLKILQGSWEQYKSDHESSSDLDFNQVKQDEMVDCTTPFCIRTKKQEAMKRLNERLRQEKLDAKLAQANSVDLKEKKKILI